MKLLVSTVAPYPWVKLNKQNMPVENGQFIEAAFISTIPREVDTIIGVAPTDSTTFHRVEVPTKKRSNMLAAVPFSLEDSLSEEIDQLHFTVLSWKPDEPAYVAVISLPTLKTWLEIFNTAGVKLDAIIPEQLLLPIHPDSDASLIKKTDGHYVIKTGAYSHFSCDQGAFDYWWQDESNRSLNIAVNDKELATQLIASGGDHVSHWAIGDDFRGWFEHASTAFDSSASLLHGDFEPEHLKPGGSWLNIAASLAICTLLLLAGSHWAEARKLQQRYDASQQAIRALFAETFPQEDYLNLPRQQIASLLSISENDPANDMFQFLLEVASLATGESKVELEEVNYRDQQLQIGATAPNFAALEQLTANINDQEGLQAALVSSGTRDQQVTGQIKIAAGSEL